MNKIFLIGNLGKDPEEKSNAVNFSLAVNKKTKAGSETLWVNVVCFDKVGENVKKYLSKGSKALIEGSLNEGKWVDKKTGEDKSKFYVTAHQVQFLDTKPKEIVKEEIPFEEDETLPF